MKFVFNAPINKVSFGQVSIALLKEIFYRSLFDDSIDVSLLPIGQVELESEKDGDDDFRAWAGERLNRSLFEHSRKNPSFKLWHLHGALESASNKQLLLSFYELDEPTEYEKLVAKENLTAFTNQETVEVFKACGVETHFIPLGFDKYSFFKTDKEYHENDQVVFNMLGKLEKRKNHRKLIRAWLKRFGNDSKYLLQCAVHNPFMSPEQNVSAFAHHLLDGEEHFNVQALPFMPSNADYNEYLNSADIVLGMSGGEGWGLPEFHSVALGKHAVILNCSGYKGWASENNAVLVEPKGKEEAYDGLFFKKGQAVNQGSIHSFDDDEFIDACEKAIKKVEENKVNEEGLKLQEEFTCSNTLDSILELLKKLN